MGAGRQLRIGLGDLFFGTGDTLLPNAEDDEEVVREHRPDRQGQPVKQVSRKML